MRYWEICEGRRQPEQSLRHLNRRKRGERRILRSEAERQELARAMYANTRRELEWIELEKARLELAQQYVELATAEAEAAKAGAEDLKDLALAGMESGERRKRAIERMARKERKRRQGERLKR